MCFDLNYVEFYNSGTMCYLYITYYDNLFAAQSNFTIQPVSVRQAEGLEAVFECRYPGDGITHSLFVNGNVIDVNVPSGDSPASLTVPTRPEYNNTVVQCEAVVRMGGSAVFVLSDNATLTVYG